MSEIDDIQLTADIFRDFADSLENGFSLVWEIIQNIHDTIKNSLNMNKIRMPDIAFDTSRFGEILDNINLNDLQMKLNTAVQMQGYSAVTPPNLKREFYDIPDDSGVKNSSVPENTERPKIIVNAVLALDGEILAEGMAELIDEKQGVLINLTKRGIIA